MVKSRFQLTIDDELLSWVDECVRKNTFNNRNEAIEFLVGCMKDLATSLGISQETAPEIKEDLPLSWEKTKNNPKYNSPKFGELVHVTTVASIDIERTLRKAADNVKEFRDKIGVN